MERIDGLLLITEIRVHHRVRVPADKEDAARRALELHDRECDVSRSIQRGINVVVTGDVTVQGARSE